MKIKKQRLVCRHPTNEHGTETCMAKWCRCRGTGLRCGPHMWSCSDCGSHHEEVANCTKDGLCKCHSPNDAQEAYREAVAAALDDLHSNQVKE